jgi:hypothetical protein
MGKQDVEPPRPGFAIGIDEGDQRCIARPPAVIAGRRRAPLPGPAQQGDSLAYPSLVDGFGIVGCVVDNHDWRPAGQRRQRGGQPVGVVADRYDDDGVERRVQDRRPGMGDTGVEETPREPLGARRARDGLARHEPVDEPPPGRRKPKQPDRRPADQHVTVIRPPGPGIERNSKPLRQGLGVADGV